MDFSLAKMGSALAIGLFFLMMLSVEVGRRIGRYRYATDKDSFSEGLGAAEGAIFALLGLLIAFTFSGAASRFEDRRHLITEEANDIGTAWLRIDLLPPADQPAMRYTDLRVVAYERVRDTAATEAKTAAALRLQGEIWQLAVAGVRKPEASPGAAQVLLPSLNAMFDIVTTRNTSTRSHPPFAIYLLLGVLCAVGAMLFGYSIGPSRNPNWLHRLAFAGVMALAIYVILDLEFPRRGLIRIDGEDKVLMELRQSFD
ncbi:MAG: hypothetical protein LW605_04570 [Xanthomonadales bacterium]|nr:hypothetical protein [Xanthomonadales bacterium]